MKVDGFSFGELRRFERGVCAMVRYLLQQPAGSYARVLFEAHEVVQDGERELNVLGFTEQTMDLTVSAHWHEAEVQFRVTFGDVVLCDGTMTEEALVRDVLPLSPAPLPPEVRGVATWLRSRGFCVMEADDGEAIGSPWVCLQVERGRLEEEVARLTAELRRRVVRIVRRNTPGGVSVTGLIDAVDDVASIHVEGLDDGVMEHPEALREVNLAIKLGMELYAVAAWFRPVPERLDVHGAFRYRDGVPIEVGRFLELVEAFAGEKTLIHAATTAYEESGHA